MLRRKLKRTTRQYISVALICIIVIGGAAIGTAIVITGQIREKYTGLLAKANQEITENQSNVYIAQSDIMSGDFITKDNVVMQTVFTEQPSGLCISAEDLGKVALIDIKVGTQVLKDMLSENTVSHEIREMEYSVINISSNIANQDSVDVRISYPNGESYIILSKKLMRGYVPETSTCNFWMDEEELIRMSAAIVDAAIYAGSSIYVTKYIEPNIQEASIVNYTPSLSILTLLESDPNILVRSSQKLSRDVRKALENRLADSIELDISQIQWNVDPYVSYISPDSNAPVTENQINTVEPTSIEPTSIESTNTIEPANIVEPTDTKMPANTEAQTNTEAQSRLPIEEVNELPEGSELGNNESNEERNVVIVGGMTIENKASVDLGIQEDSELGKGYFIIGG